MLSGMIRTVKDLTDKFDRIRVAMDRVDMSMVNYADDAAKGQISTESLVRQLNMLNQAAPKLKITQEQFGIISARAAEFADATDAPGGATAVFERMTNGIARAESEALKPFGIKLKENIDMTKTQTQAVDALTKGHEDFEYTIKSNGQRMNRLSNNLSTFSQAIWNVTGELPGMSTALDNLNFILGETNRAITETAQSVRDWAFSFEQLRDIAVPVLQLISGAMTGNMSLASLSVGSSISKLITRGINDPDLRKAVEAELKAREEKKYGVPVAPMRAGAGGGPTPVDLSGGIGLGFGAEYWAKALQLEITPENADWLESFSRRMGSMALKSFQFHTNAKELGFLEGMSGKIEMPSFDRGMAFSSAGSSVDQRLAEADAERKIVEAKERRLELVTDEFEIMRQVKEINDEELIQMQEVSVLRRARLELVSTERYQEERLREMREEDNISRIERQIQLQFEREQALDFAMNFADTWNIAFENISAGALAANGVLGIMKGTWSAIVTAAIEGHNSIGEAIANTIKAIGIQIAIEAGLNALISAGYAVYYAMKKDYTAAAKAGTAAGLFAATAVVAGVAAASASAFGKSASSIKKTSIPTSVSGSGSSYGGGYSGAGYGIASQDKVEVVIRLSDDAGTQMFQIVKEGNRMASRSGEASFQEIGSR
jgi:hypothetical protein